MAMQVDGEEKDWVLDALRLTLVMGT